MESKNFDVPKIKMPDRPQHKVIQELAEKLNKSEQKESKDKK